MAVAFVCAARLHAHRVTAVHTSCRQSVQCSTHARYVFFFLPTGPSPSPSPCWRCTTRCCGEAKRHHIRLYHGWPARVATCALLARLPAQRCACGSQYCHYLIPRGHQSKHAQTSCLPIANHAAGASSAPGACWESPLILLSPACST